MTDIDSLAAALFGSKRAESQEVLTDATTRTYVGTALTDSKDGTVMVDLGGDVTLPDDVEGLTEHSAEGIEVSTGPGVHAGDEVVVTLVGGTPLKTPMVTGVAGEGDGQNERIHAIEADYVKATTLEADVADIGFLKADSATIKGLQADAAKVHDLTADQLSAATAYIASLNAKSVTAETLAADVAKVHDLTADGLSAAAAYIAQLSADSVTAQRIAAISGDFDTVRANAAKVANLTAAELEADHATVGTLDANYAKITNGHIDSALIDTAAIVDEQVFTVTGNKATLAQIDASKINVLNLKAKDIEVERINGQPVTNKTLVDALSQHESDISDLDSKIDNEVEALNDRIDGAIETFTGTVAPTLSNAPASSWNTTKLKDQHVGDVYYVVNGQSAQNGYCYRFTKSGSTYSWQLIKDSDVTAALSRLQTAEGKIGSIEQFDETVGSFMTDTDDELSSLKTKTTNLETSLGDKVDTSTFNTVSQKVDANESNITSMSTVLTNNGLTSSTNITNTVNTVRQTAETNTSNISSLQTTVSGHTTTIGQHTTAIQQNTNDISLRATKTEVQQVRPAYASSSTAAGTAAKVATIDPAVTGYALYKGASVAVTFSTANTAATPTLNLNSTGAKQIRSYTGATLSEAEYKWAAGATVDLVYDGTYWRMQDGGSVKRVTAAEASISVNAENIESKVSKDGVISSINQSAESVKIQASKVEIDGTAVFTAISSDVDDAITSKGYQTSSQVNSAITSKGYATTTQAQGYATTAKSEAISAAASDATTKANAAQTAATNAANTATDNKLKSYSTTAQANNLYDAKGAAAAVETNSGNLFLGASMADRSTFTNNSSTDFSRHFRYYNGSASIHSFSEYSPGVYQDTVTLESSGNLGIAFARMADEMGLDSTSSYTITCWAKCSKAGMNLAIGLSYYNTSNSWVWRGGTNATAFSAADTWQKFSLTFKPDANTKAICYCFTVAGGTGSETFTIRNCWLEKNAAYDAQSTANAAAPKASAVKRTQRIWYRTNASGAPSTPGTASSNWVTKADDGNDAWTKMHIAINSTHKYIYTCEQYEMANGTVGYTSVLLDNTITVIDGGNIITGSVTANKLNAADINASNSLTVGAMTDAAASSILNSNVQIGGRNLLRYVVYNYADASNVVGVNSAYRGMYCAVNGGETYTISRRTVEGNRFWIDWSEQEPASGVALHKLSTNNTALKVTVDLPSEANWLFIYLSNQGDVINDGNIKVERGNKATDWTPAPEDQTAYMNETAYQFSQPNLSPFFSMSESDVYNASTNPSGYWKTFSSNYITVLDDGWAHVSASNTGSNYVFCNYFTAKDAVPESFKTSTKYTFLVETRNVTRSGSIAILATSYFANELHAFTASPAFNVTGAESRYLSVTSASDISSIACFTRGYVQVAAGASIEMDFRISIYEGEYTGPYKPYSGDQLYATNMELASTNESLEGAITDIGELSDQLVGTITEQNKTITDIQTYLNSLRKDLDAEIQSRQQWLNFNAAEGLVIGAAGSSFKTVTTNTSQQFRSGGTVLAETSGTEFVAPVMRSDQILIGNWMWTRRDNGNLSLKWIG